MTKITKAEIIAGLKQIDGDELTQAQLTALLAAIASMAEARNPGTEPEVEAEVEAKAKAKADKASEEMAASARALAAEPDMAAVVVADAPPIPETDAVQADAAAAEMVGAKLAEATGMAGAALLAAVETNLDAVVGAIKGSGGQIAELTAASAAGSIAALSARLAVFERREAAAVDSAARAAKAVALAATESEIAGLVSSGSILPGMVDTFRALAREAPVQYRALAAALPKGTAFPAGRNMALSAADSTPVSVGAVDETRAEVRALRAMYSNRPRADADAAVARAFGSTTRVG